MNSVAGSTSKARAIASRLAVVHGLPRSMRAIVLAPTPDSRPRRRMDQPRRERSARIVIAVVVSSMGKECTIFGASVNSQE